MTTAREDGKHYRLDELRNSDILSVLEYEFRYMRYLEEKNKKSERGDKEKHVKKVSYDGNNPKEVIDSW